MGRWNLEKIEVVLISMTLLVLALVGARAHASPRLETLEKLRSWKSEIAHEKTLSPREKDLRLDFVDRLLFQTERKYQDGAYKEFLKSTLEDMASTDELTINQSFGSISEFLLNLQGSMELLEKNEDPMAFVRNFTEYSTVSQPKNPDDFALTRSYYDGKNILQAQPLEIDQAGALAEEKEIQASLPLTLETKLLQKSLVDELDTSSAKSLLIP